MFNIKLYFQLNYFDIVFIEIDVESDDETLYQSKHSSQIKRDQHSSLPDLTESLTGSTNTSQISDHIEPSSSTSSVSTSAISSPISPIKINSKRMSIKNNKNKICSLFSLFIGIYIRCPLSLTHAHTDTPRYSHDLSLLPTATNSFPGTLHLSILSSDY